jgi:hypothetical protein
MSKRRSELPYFQLFSKFNLSNRSCSLFCIDIRSGVDRRSKWHIGSEIINENTSNTALIMAFPQCLTLSSQTDFQADLDIGTVTLGSNYMLKSYGNYTDLRSLTVILLWVCPELQIGQLGLCLQ